MWIFQMNIHLNVAFFATTCLHLNEDENYIACPEMSFMYCAIWISILFSWYSLWTDNENNVMIKPKLQAYYYLLLPTKNLLSEGNVL